MDYVCAKYVCAKIANKLIFIKFVCKKLKDEK